MLLYLGCGLLVKLALSARYPRSRIIRRVCILYATFFLTAFVRLRVYCSPHIIPWLCLTPSCFSRYHDNSTFFMEKVTEEQEPYNSDICCVAMSSCSNIQLVSRPEHGRFLIQSLQMISNSLMESSQYTIQETKLVNGWAVCKFKEGYYDRHNKLL